ncbi:Unknown protein, partial [Striga hermonthica]
RRKAQQIDARAHEANPVSRGSAIQGSTIQGSIMIGSRLVGQEIACDQARGRERGLDARSHKSAKEGRAWRNARARKKVVRKRANIERKEGRVRQKREYAHWRRRAWRLEIRRSGAQREDVGRLMRTRDCSKWTSTHRALDDTQTALSARGRTIDELSSGALSGPRGQVDRHGNIAGLSSVGSSCTVDKDPREQVAHGRAACAVGDAGGMGQDLGLVGLGKLGDTHEIVTQAKGAIACAPERRGKTKAASLVLIGIGMARILDPAGLGKAVECRDAREGSVTGVILGRSGNVAGSIFLVGIGKMDMGSKSDPSRNRNSVHKARDLTPRGKVQIAAYHLDAEANIWWQWVLHKNQGEHMRWRDFERELIMRFGSSDYHDYNEALSRIKQVGSLREYQKEFERIASRVRDWPESALVGTFVGGLKAELAAEVRLDRPGSMRSYG